MKRTVVLIILLSMLAISLTVLAASPRRTSRDVRRDKQKTEQQIARTQKQIHDNDRETGRQLDRLQSIEAGMALRSDTIVQIKNKLDSVNRAIKIHNDSIARLEQQSETLKASYAKTIRAIRSFISK